MNNQGGSPRSLWGLDGMSDRIHDGEGRPQKNFRTGSSSPSLGEHLFTCLRDVRNRYLWWQERAGLGFWWAEEGRVFPLQGKLKALNRSISALSRWPQGFRGRQDPPPPLPTSSEGCLHGDSKSLGPGCLSLLSGMISQAPHPSLRVFQSN